MVLKQMFLNVFVLFNKIRFKNSEITAQETFLFMLTYKQVAHSDLILFHLHNFLEDCNNNRSEGVIKFLIVIGD